jgi:hypothetical protein
MPDLNTKINTIVALLYRDQAELVKFFLHISQNII